MKSTFEIAVVFKVKAETAQEARENVARLIRYGFEALSEHERATWKVIKRWSWAAIRRQK